MDKMAPKYKGKVTFVAINIDDDSTKGKKFFNGKLKIKNLIKVYMPAANASADDAYATGTFPSTFVIDPKGVLVYAGAIDDRNTTDAADVAQAKNYVAQALDEAMAGKPVTTPSTLPYGCSVKYKN